MWNKKASFEAPVCWNACDGRETKKYEGTLWSFRCLILHRISIIVRELCSLFKAKRCYEDTNERMGVLISSLGWTRYFLNAYTIFIDHHDNVFVSYDFASGQGFAQCLRLLYTPKTGRRRNSRASIARKMPTVLLPVINYQSSVVWLWIAPLLRRERMRKLPKRYSSLGWTHYFLIAYTNFIDHRWIVV